MLTSFHRTTSRRFSTPPVVKVLSLDVRDTLICMKESPAEVYSRLAKENNLDIKPDQILEKFLKNYKRLSSVSPCFGANGAGSKQWWKEVVASTLIDCSPDSEQIRVGEVAERLYDYYGTSEPWKLVEDDIRQTLQKIRLKGIHLVVTSNFDSRLKSLLAQFNLSDLFSMIILSVGEILTKKSETGKETVSDDSEDSDDQTIAVATHSFAATGEAGPSGPLDSGATATLEVDTDYTRDAQAQFERVQQQLKEGIEKDGKILYKGAALYGAKEAKDTAKGNASSGYNRVGPVRAPQFLRQTVRWDFAPDICKDYKETGFCTFGDSCKFVHDRSDYKHGWEIDEEYEAGNYGVDDQTDYEIRDQDDAFPEDCFICGNPFVDPIVTKCKHYFCTGCALKAFQKSSKCPICHQNTEKIMNAAKDLINFLKRKKQQETEKNMNKEIDDDQEEEHAHNCEDHDHDHHETEDPEKEEEPENDNVENDLHNNTPSDEEQEILMEDVEGLEGGEVGSDSDEDESND
uniref:RING-type E3 ubiquitin transferase n=1 Tax=Caenorhabditis tropicalis TaxID=1561998 RepID=A0A1I7TM71_9PELO